MRTYVIFSFWLLSVVKVAVITGITSCANIIPPSGGPRDSLPPVLLKVTPADSTLNFSANRIVFLFNEFIELQNVYQNLIMSPLPQNMPTVDYRLNTMTVKLRDSLEANTTYTLQFGECIKDFTEGNVLKNFNYTFSTGSYFDSLVLKGKVVLAETGKTDTTLIVMLHSSPDDSAVVKQKPRYITKLDSRGNFIFKNLPARKFYLYALKDEGGSGKYYDEKQLFAFADQPVIVSDTTPDITLYAYASKPVQQNVKSGLSLGGRIRPGGTAEKRLKYQTNLINDKLDLLSNLTFTFEEPLKKFDSIKIKLYTDSVFNPVRNYSFQLDSLGKTITLFFERKENTLYHIIMEKDFAEDSLGRKLLKTDTLSFTTKKLSEYGSLRITFKNLDLNQHPVLLIVSGETILQSVPLSGNVFTQALFNPGEYELRLLYDRNKNLKWDPGQFFGKRIQPELVISLEKKISVKASFQNEYDITL